MIENTEISVTWSRNGTLMRERERERATKLMKTTMRERAKDGDDGATEVMKTTTRMKANEARVST